MKIIYIINFHDIILIFRIEFINKNIETISIFKKIKYFRKL